MQPIFPQLASLVVFQFISINEDSRDTLLFAIAGGSSMRTFTWNTCSNRTHHSRALFDWLFRCSVNLVSYKLQTPPRENGFELKYEYTIVNAYVPHRSLVYLQISILNLNTLYVLLHYLPQLKHLDVYISSIIDSINTTDQYLATKLNYPETLRVLNLRLSRLRSLNFAIHLQFIERRSTQTLTDFAQTFRTPFWLDGPLGRIQFCMTYDQAFNFVQIFSLPYTFSDNILFYTIDLIDVLFNNSEEEKERPNNLSIALRPLWCGMRWLFISMVEKQKIPISFIHALQCSCSQNKILVISDTRGILPDNIEDHIQLTHFTTLQLLSSFDTNNTYDLQRMLRFILSFIS
ncbi:unnamed protein product [Rotaria magnacalcarata]|uniref:Uncharacterized protein n=3 Tax=Rotaria magnacalcarata TaxID=392030 RepID=A0A8S2X9C5_9BILA|nr:unnamed protein product [Rotaria magnacalcarata]